MVTGFHRQGERRRPRRDRGLRIVHSDGLRGIHKPKDMLHASYLKGND